MELKDVKVGQRVFVKRESTAKLDDPLASAIGETMKTIAKLLGMDIVEVCKENDGFYIKRILKEGNVELAEKDGNGSWGVFNVSDIELADKPKTNDPVVIDIILKEILKAFNEIKVDLNAIKSTLNDRKPETKRGRGRPKGSTSKKYKKEK